jgi:hypothetical protein
MRNGFRCGTSYSTHIILYKIKKRKNNLNKFLHKISNRNYLFYNARSGIRTHEPEGRDLKPRRFNHFLIRARRTQPTINVCPNNYTLICLLLAAHKFYRTEDFKSFHAYIHIYDIFIY